MVGRMGQQLGVHRVLAGEDRVLHDPRTAALASPPTSPAGSAWRGPLTTISADHGVARAGCRGAGPAGRPALRAGSPPAPSSLRRWQLRNGRRPRPSEWRNHRSHSPAATTGDQVDEAELRRRNHAMAISLGKPLSATLRESTGTTSRSAGRAGLRDPRRRLSLDASFSAPGRSPTWPKSPASPGLSWWMSRRSKTEQPLVRPRSTAAAGGPQEPTRADAG